MTLPSAPASTDLTDLRRVPPRPVVDQDCAAGPVGRPQRAMSPSWGVLQHRIPRDGPVRVRRGDVLQLRLLAYLVRSSCVRGSAVRQTFPCNTYAASMPEAIHPVGGWNCDSWPIGLVH